MNGRSVRSRPEERVDPRLSRLDPAQRALLERELARRRTATPTSRPTAPDRIPRRRPGDPSPLSSAQLSMWFFDQWEPGTFVYNAYLCFRVRGAVDVAALEAAVDDLLRRHTTLRTVFRVEPGADEPVQHVLESWTPVFTHRRADDLDAAVALLREAARQPFDLAADLMLRVHVVDLASDDRLVMLASHHIALDNWSGGLLCADLSELYAARVEGREPALADLPIDARDYARWQRDRLQGERLATLTEHWRRHLEGAPPVLQLPFDRPRPPVQRFHGARAPIDLPAEVAAAVTRAAREAGVTPFMYLLALFGILLARWSGQTDLVIGTPAANRGHVDLEALVGLLTNTVVMRIRLDGNPTVAEAVGRVRDVALANYAHVELPFERIVDAAAPPRDPAYHPLFQVNFRVAPPNRPVLTMPGADVEPVALDIGYSKFDLAMELHLHPDRLGGHLEYNEELFEPATIAALVDGFTQVLTTALAEPSRNLATLPMVEPARAPVRRIGARRSRPHTEVAG
jgi:hypothetical protein